MQIAYAAIPRIRSSSLDPDVRRAVEAAFARATRLIWQVMIGVSGAGLVTVLLMREVRLRRDRDETWGLQEKGASDGSGKEVGNDSSTAVGVDADGAKEVGRSRSEVMDWSVARSSQDV